METDLGSGFKLLPGIWMFTLPFTLFTHVPSQTFATSVLEPSPPAVPFLTMIRIIENTLAEVQTRGCVTLETWLFGLRMQFWPIFQKLMSEHVSSLNRLAEAGTGGLFRRAAGPTDETIRLVIASYDHVL